VSLKEKQRLYFLYEKRIRELSNAEKVYEYFANEKRGDGSAFMRPQVLPGTFWGFSSWNAASHQTVCMAAA
jgi:hypothetical protein